MRGDGELTRARRRLVLTTAVWSVILLVTGLVGWGFASAGGLEMLVPGVLLLGAVVTGAAFWIREALIAVEKARER